jgi:ABC-type spermidine/putrescine transport system permease subunit I
MYFILPFLIFMVIIFFVPMLFVIATSVMTSDMTAFTLEFYEKFFSQTLYLRVLYTSLEIALASTAVTLLLGYPLAYFLAKQTPRRRVYLSTLLLLPFYTSILVKSFAFQIILGHDGIINWALSSVFGHAVHLAMLHNRVGVLFGVVHDMLPFLVFPIVVSLLAQDPALHRAATVMGATRTRIFWKITFPLSLPGVFAGVFLVVVRALGEYAVPQLLGGRKDMMMANLVGFHINQVLDWNMAAAVSMVLMAVSAIFLIALGRMRGGEMIVGG